MSDLQSHQQEQEDIGENLEWEQEEGSHEQGCEDEGEKKKKKRVRKKRPLSKAKKAARAEAAAAAAAAEAAMEKEEEEVAGAGSTSSLPAVEEESSLIAEESESLKMEAKDDVGESDRLKELEDELALSQAEAAEKQAWLESMKAKYEQASKEAEEYYDKIANLHNEHDKLVEGSKELQLKLEEETSKHQDTEATLLHAEQRVKELEEEGREQHRKIELLRHNVIEKQGKLGQAVVYYKTMRQDINNKNDELNKLQERNQELEDERQKCAKQLEEATASIEEHQAFVDQTTETQKRLDEKTLELIEQERENAKERIASKEKLEWYEARYGQIPSDTEQADNAAGEESKPDDMNVPDNSSADNLATQMPDEDDTQLDDTQLDDTQLEEQEPTLEMQEAATESATADEESAIPVPNPEQMVIKVVRPIVLRLDINESFCRDITRLLIWCFLFLGVWGLFQMFFVESELHKWQVANHQIWEPVWSTRKRGLSLGNALFGEHGDSMWEHFVATMLFLTDRDTSWARSGLF